MPAVGDEVGDALGEPARCVQCGVGAGCDVKSSCVNTIRNAEPDIADAPGARTIRCPDTRRLVGSMSSATDTAAMSSQDRRGSRCARATNSASVPVATTFI